MRTFNTYITQTRKWWDHALLKIRHQSASLTFEVICSIDTCSGHYLQNQCIINIDSKEETETLLVKQLSRLSHIFLVAIRLLS